MVHDQDIVELNNRFVERSTRLLRARLVREFFLALATVALSFVFDN